jgi:hypothetical protein
MNQLKKLVLLLGLVFTIGQARADEGMWLPIQVAKIHGKMLDRGLKLSADDIYSINQASLKDAIVRLGGGFCTAEIVSKEGLLMTNHHCAYDLIQNHSSVEKDYLTDGFWAMSRSEELTNPGLTASILVRMEDVTSRVLKALEGVEDDKKAGVIAKTSKEIAEEAKKEGEGYTADVRPIFYGNQYILSVYITYKDVRLVGAPPSSIGKFGGDTDNWMWPRHTGDFSMLRIYTDANGKPAEYSPENIPLAPKKWLPVSMEGVKENDYVMIMGYPGTTNRYLTAANLESNLDYYNQAIIDLYGVKMRLMKEAMDADAKTRIALASTYASGMNTYKYFIGQSNGLRKDGLVEKKAAYEARLTEWINADANRKAKYGNIIEDMAADIAAFGPLNQHYLYFAIGLLGNGVYNHYNLLGEISQLLEEKKPDAAKLKAAAENTRGKLDDAFAEYYPALDQKTFGALLFQYYREIPAEKHPEFLTKLLAKDKKKDARATLNEYAAMVYSKSVLTDRSRLEKFLDKPTAKVLDKDPGVAFAKEIFKSFMGNVNPPRAALNGQLAAKRKLLMAAMMEFENTREFAPDANSTMRVTYGNVLSYVPRDAVSYKFYTTAEGILQKENPKDEEFIVPAKLKELLVKKDYGRYATNGVLYTGFISNNDITGGNSGSPVINAKGELVGVAFDGNWESMTGDLMFSTSMQRCISVDIRYVLFVIDKFAGAGHLVDEMLAK